MAVTSAPRARLITTSAGFLRSLSRVTPMSGPKTSGGIVCTTPTNDMRSVEWLVW